MKKNITKIFLASTIILGGGTTLNSTELNKRELVKINNTFDNNSNFSRNTNSNQDPRKLINDLNDLYMATFKNLMLVENIDKEKRQSVINMWYFCQTLSENSVDIADNIKNGYINKNENDKKNRIYKYAQSIKFNKQNINIILHNGSQLNVTIPKDTSLEQLLRELSVVCARYSILMLSNINKSSIEDDVNTLENVIRNNINDLIKVMENMKYFVWESIYSKLGEFILNDSAGNVIDIKDELSKRLTNFSENSTFLNDEKEKVNK